MYFKVGLDQNIQLFKYSFGGLAFDFQLWHFEYSFFFFFYLASPAKRFTFALEYKLPNHDSVGLEEKTKMQKTSAVWDHFKLSEDKTQFCK